MKTIQRLNDSTDLNHFLVKDYLTTITILDHIPDAIFILDYCGNIQYANKTATDILRIELNKLIGTNICDFLFLDFYVTAADPKKKSAIFKEYVSHVQLNESESILISKDYSTPVVISCGFIKNSENNIKYIVFSAKDITVRKQFEKESKEKQELAISRDKIRALGDLAINLVHELTQPLSTLKINLELIQKNIHNKKSDINAIKNNIDKVKSLLEQVSITVENTRDFALKVEDDSFRLVDINLCIKNALKHIEYELLDKKIKIKLNSEDDLPLVSANQVSLEYAFVSLIKFCQPGISAGDRQSPADSNKITIFLYTVDKSWVGIKIESKDIKNVSSHELDLNLITELSVIRAIISSFGGDIKIGRKKSRDYCISIKIPADQKEERAQLINLFNLLPKD